MNDSVDELRRRAVNFEKDAHDILSRVESSQSRVISLSDSKTRLKHLSIKQDRLLKEALLCIEYKLYRSAHVSAWAAFMDYLEHKIEAYGLERLKELKKYRCEVSTIEQFREDIPESHIIEIAREIGLFSRNETTIVKGLLAKRNQCAHPTDYDINLNNTLGYISDIIYLIEKIAGK